jgi:hypothetical protein
MRQNILFGTVALATLGLLMVTSRQNDLVRADTGPFAVPVEQKMLLDEIFVSNVAYVETARFEFVDSWTANKRGERLMPVPTDTEAARTEPVAGVSLVIDLGIGETQLVQAIVEELIAPVPPARPAWLDDGGLTAPRVDTAMALAAPDPSSSAHRLQPSTAVEAIAASVRGFARRVSEGSTNALLSFN